MTEKYDLVVIGSGPGGYVAAIRAAQLGFRVACVEKDPSLGGTCLNVGCIPSKALLHSTHIYSQLLQKGAELGIDYKNLSINFAQMMIHKEKVVKSLVDGVAGLFSIHKVKRFLGKARFVSSHQIEVTQDQEKVFIEGDRFIIATGSEAIPLAQCPFDETVVLSSTGALNLTEIPKKMIVIGAGYIGVEIASIYQRLGTEVVVIELLDHICPAMDEMIRARLLQTLKKQGINFYLSTKLETLKVTDQQVFITASNQSQELAFQAPVALVAIGRRPYFKGLGLEEIGVALTSDGFVNINSSFQTSIAHIYAIGDLIKGPMLAHKASAEGVAVVELMAGQSSSLNYSTIPSVIYTDPEVAAVGLTEREAHDNGLAIQVGLSFFKGNARARCQDETDGFVKIIGEKKTGRLIGLHIIGSQASELINEGMIAIQQKTTLNELVHAPYAHPTLSEALQEAAWNAITN